MASPAAGPEASLSGMRGLDIPENDHEAEEIIARADSLAASAAASKAKTEPAAVA